MLFEARQVATAHSPPVNFTLTAGAVLSVFGASGSGKSQLLRALADVSPHTGEVLLEGVAQTAMRPEQWRKRVGYVPAESGWWADTVAAHFTNKPSKSWLDALSLPADLLAAPVERLSSGERQRLAVLRALTVNPRVLLLDEPTANLDDHNARAMAQLVLSYVHEHNAAAVWVSHSLEERLRLGENSLEIHASAIITPQGDQPHES
ncbi:MAG: ABC transporter ATP-binding protein [Halothiobacillus sp.]